MRRRTLYCGPLSWEPGRAVDQLQMYLLGADGTYRIEIVCLDEAGQRVEEVGVQGAYEMGGTTPAFGIATLALANTRVDCRPTAKRVRSGEERRQDGEYPIWQGRLHGVSQGNAYRGHGAGVRAGALHGVAGRGVPHCAAEAGRLARV